MILHWLLQEHQMQNEREKCTLRMSVVPLKGNPSDLSPVEDIQELHWFPSLASII